MADGLRLQRLILRAASLLAPRDQRAAWLEEWRSELWYIPRRGATRFCLGAFQDALWLRRNNPSPVLRLESPLRCLAFLAALAVVSLLIVMRVPGPHGSPWPSHFRTRDLPEGCIAMLLLTCLILPATRLVMGPPPANRHPGKLRRGIFLALKIALLQPLLLCSFVVSLALHAVPMAPTLGLFASWIFAFRWLLTDQRNRCPVCLRLLTSPVRIGSPSQTFLEWYGAESMCSRGHGLLHASYSGKQQWLGLDASWTGLFSATAGMGRQ